MGDLNWLTARILACEGYLEMLTTTLHGAWNKTYQRFLEYPELRTGFAIIHPAHYNEIPRFEPRGARIFISQPGAIEPCSARRIWGYDCRFRASKSQADHLFPWSLGGPTVGANRVPLCWSHNQMKGSDVHLFPWDEGLPTWLPPMVEAIASARSVHFDQKDGGA